MISMIGFREVTKLLKLDEDINDIGKVFMVTDTIKIEEIVVDAIMNFNLKVFHQISILLEVDTIVI